MISILSAHFQVFIEAFILAMRPAGSPCPVILASEVVCKVLMISLS
jgi:hypothetical protein